VPNGSENYVPDGSEISADNLAIMSSNRSSLTAVKKVQVVRIILFIFKNFKLSREVDIFIGKMWGCGVGGASESPVESGITSIFVDNPAACRSSSIL
jgi:hypothetical protein